MFILILLPDNEIEAKTLKRIVNEIKPYTATSKVIFMYKVEGCITTEKKYEKKRKEAQESMHDFEYLFDDLRGSIINTDLEILHFAENTIMFPTMDEEEETLSEKLFLGELKQRFEVAFDTISYNKKENTKA